MMDRLVQVASATSSGPVQGLDLGLSSTDTTIAFSGGFRYRPITSVTLVTSPGRRRIERLRFPPPDTKIFPRISNRGVINTQPRCDPPRGPVRHPRGLRWWVSGRRSSWTARVSAADPGVPGRPNPRYPSSRRVHATGSVDRLPSRG